MAYTFDKQDDSIVVAGWEKGIATSPIAGLGNIQCANISTVPGEVMSSYARTRDTQDYTITATLTELIVGGTDISYVASNGSYLFAGAWVSITNSTMPQVPNGTYWIVYSNQSGNKRLALSATYNGAAINTVSGNPNTATLAFLANTTNSGGVMSKPVQGATEFYTDVNGISQNRYYLLDQEGHVWVKDTAVATVGIEWSQIDITTARSSASLGTGAMATGIAVYNGWLIIFIQDTILAKLTSALGINITSGTPGTVGWFKVASTSNGILNTPVGINNPHFAYASKSGILYWTDGSFIGALAAVSGTPSIFSYGTYTFATTTITLTATYSGAKPYGGMPLYFFSSAGTSGLPTGISAATQYFVKIGSVSNSGGVITFQIAATPTGSAISLSGGSGTQYYNTLDLTWYVNNPSFVLSPQALTIGQEQDLTQCLTEIGNQILIGCQSNTLYFWDGLSITPNGYLFLPEQNTVNMITVNNMGYIFSGSRGNIYITNGNTASAVTSVPDYITQVIDPYFVWGGAMYARGRVWFSIQDQNASKTGYCGGIWSFVPTQNLFIGQDSGLALRQENQSSYGTYNGVTNVLINIQNQNANGVQYFSAWTSSVTSPVYGIDTSATTPYTGGQTIIETDLIPIGNYLDKGNFTSIMTKYDAPLAAGESVQLKYRNDITSAWNAFTDVYSGTDNVVGSVGLRFSAPFALKMQVQLQIILTSVTSSPSFVRFKELRIKK